MPEDKNRFRYCGEYMDKESGNVYLRARYYDPSSGRFISEDSYEGKINEPLSLNLYTYCSNNPVISIDPSGHDELGDAMLAAQVDAEDEALSGDSSCDDNVSTGDDVSTGDGGPSSITDETEDDITDETLYASLRTAGMTDEQAKQYVEFYLNTKGGTSIIPNVDVEPMNLDMLGGIPCPIWGPMDLNINMDELINLKLPDMAIGITKLPPGAQSPGASVNYYIPPKKEYGDHSCWDLGADWNDAWGMFGDTWNDPGTGTAFKNTAIAVATTTGVAAIHPIAAGVQLVGGVAYEAYTSEYGASTTRLISPTTHTTIEGLCKYFKP